MVKKYKGGEIIGQGTFGKVIRPGIICDTSNYVSKVFTGQNAIESQKTEILFLSKMKDIDPEENFTINNFQSCNVSSDIPELTNIKNTNKQKSFPQVVFRYGGLNLYNIITNNSIKFTLENIINLISNFMMEFKKFQEKEFTHNDIKSMNMLYNENKFYLIDYSLTVNNSDLFKKDNINILGYIYPTYPPEFQLISDIYKNCNNYESVLSYLKKNKSLIIANMFLNISKDPLESTLYKQNPNVYILNATQYIDQIIKYLEENNLKNYDIESIIELIFGYNKKKVDIYALGVVFSTFLKTKCNSNKNFDKNIYDELDNLLAKMKEINPVQRCSITQIINKLKKINNYYVSNMQTGGDKKNNSNKNSMIQPDSFMTEIMQKLSQQENIKSPEISEIVRLKQMKNIIEK